MSSPESDSDAGDLSPDAEEEVHYKMVASTCIKKGGRKTKAPPLPDELKPKVLEYLRERPYFFDKSHSGYNARRQEWKHFAESHGVQLASMESWIRSMRTMLGRAMRLKSKSGSADAPLPRSLQWVWENMDFMKPFIGSISNVPMGQSKRTAAEASEYEFDPDQPGPSRKAPRYAEPDFVPAPDLAEDAVPGPSGYRLPSTSFSQAPAPTPSAPFASNCCGHLCAELDSMVQRWSKPFDQFLSNLSWMVDHFSKNQLLRLQHDLMAVTLKHLSIVGERPEDPSLPIVPPQVLGSNSGIGGAVQQNPPQPPPQPLQQDFFPQPPQQDVFPQPPQQDFFPQPPQQDFFPQSQPPQQVTPAADAEESLHELLLQNFQAQLPVRVSPSFPQTWFKISSIKQEVEVESTETAQTTPEIKEKTVEDVKAQKEAADNKTEEKEEKEATEEGDKNDNASTEESDAKTEDKTEEKTDDATEEATGEKRSADEENGEDESPTKKVKTADDSESKEEETKEESA